MIVCVAVSGGRGTRPVIALTNMSCVHQCTLPTRSSRLVCLVTRTRTRVRLEPHFLVTRTRTRVMINNDSDSDSDSNLRTRTWDSDSMFVTRTQRQNAQYSLLAKSCFRLQNRCGDALFWWLREVSQIGQTFIPLCEKVV